MSLSAKQLERYKQVLTELREQVLNRLRVGMSDSADLSIAKEDLADEADHASAILQQNINVETQERNRHLLKEVEHALDKFETGMYGICEDTEEEIDPARLDAQPHTRYCVEAAEMREQHSRKFSKAG